MGCWYEGERRSAENGILRRFALMLVECWKVVQIGPLTANGEGDRSQGRQHGVPSKAMHKAMLMGSNRMLRQLHTPKCAWV